MNISQRTRHWAQTLVSVLALVATGTAAAQGSTYACDARFYQIRQPTGASGSNLYLLDRRNLSGGGTAQWGAVTSAPLNALAYNKADGYFYATNVNPLGTGAPYRLYRLGTTGAVEVAPLGNIPSASTVAAGTVDASGKMYIKLLQSDSTIYTVQLPTTPGGVIGATGTLTLNSSVALADMAFDPVTSQLYGVYTANVPASDGATVGGVVYQINPTTGAVTRNGTALAVSGTNAIGTAFFDTSGTLYAYQNGGSFGTINLSTGAFTRLTAASAASQSDGASCVFPDERVSGSKVAGTVIARSPTVFDVPYTVTATNTGAIPDRNLQITEDLRRTFGATPTLSVIAAPTVTSGSATVNPSFDGVADTRLLSGVNTLAVGATVTVTFTVRVTYPTTASVPGVGSPVNNTVYVSSTSTGPNAGYTFPGGTPLPPVDLVATYTTPPASATIRNDVDLSITKAGPTTTVAGTTISYVLTLTNAGPGSAGGATFSDAAPTGLTGVSAVCQNAAGGVSGCVATVSGTNVITGTVGTFPSGGSVQVLITGTVPAAATGTLSNQATVSPPSGLTDPTPGNNTSATVTTTLTRTSDLAVDASAPAAVGSSGGLTYTVRVWNNGPSVTSAASVPVTLPAGFTVTGLTCTPTGTATCGTQSFTASSVNIITGTLTVDTTPANTTPDGTFVTYTLTGTAPVGGSLSLSAGVTAPGGVTDNDTSNNTSAAVTRVIDAVNDATVTLAAGAGGTVSVLGNDTVGGTTATTTNSTVTISNNGGITGLTVNASSQLVVPTTTPPGTYTVTYTLCDRNVTTACDAATAGVSVSAASPNLAVSVSGPANARPSTVASTNPPVAATDSFITYTLTVSATVASATGTTTVITTLPSGLSWSGSSAAGPGTWTCAASGQVITCTTTSTIAVGTNHTITLQNVKVAPGTAAGATFTTAVTVSNPAETPADAAAGNADSATTKLIYTTVTKEVRNVTLDNRDNGGVARFTATTTGLPGDVLEYCFDTQNRGGADLLKYTLRDTLSVLSVPVLSVTADPAYANNAIRWTRVTPGTPVVTTTGSYTAASGDDAGTLSSTLTVNLGTLLAGETVRTCIQTTIR